MAPVGYFRVVDCVARLYQPGLLFALEVLLGTLHCELMHMLLDTASENVLTNTLCDFSPGREVAVHKRQLADKAAIYKKLMLPVPSAPILASCGNTSHSVTD